MYSGNNHGKGKKEEERHLKRRMVCNRKQSNDPYETETERTKEGLDTTEEGVVNVERGDILSCFCRLPVR